MKKKKYLLYLPVHTYGEGNEASIMAEMKEKSGVSIK